MSTPATGSTTTVDPGKIKQFAQFLDDIAERFDTVVVKELAKAPGDDEPFGSYNESALATKRHAELVADSRTNVAKLHERMTNLASATHSLATKYTTVDELNEAEADDITTAIAQAKEA